ncbi:MAG: ABC transporter permease subunit, partial [Microbacteriaceae bacterium]|nr:ABC transporter permease subunit [Burkholderiaceae bacterium]
AVLLWWLAVWLGWSGLVGGGPVERAALPCLLLALAALGPLAAVLRTSWRATAASPHLRAALARGALPGRALAGQGRRQALAALAAAIAAEAAFAAGGAAVLESLFSVAGIGAWAVDAARARDWPVLQAVLFAAILWCALVQAAAGWARRRLDPRPVAL